MTHSAPEVISSSCDAHSAPKVFISSCDAHYLKYVEAVLQSLEKANLSLKLNKCKFGIFLVSRDFTEI